MADGYARATGKVGVAIATSGPGATNMVTGIATAMMDSSPIVCITGQVGSKLIGSDAFQETDITGITLPITKHNYLVTRPRTSRRRSARRSRSRSPAAPARCSIDITKDAQQALAASSTGTPPRRICRGLSADALPGDGDLRAALALINAAKRPLILAGHGIMLSGAERRSLALAERAQHSGRDDAARHRRLPGLASAEPRHDGHARRGLGQHRDPGSRSADRARHALRRSRHRQPQDLRAATPRRSTSTSTPPRSTRTCRSTSRSSATCAPTLDALLPHVAPGDRVDWLAHIAELKGDSAVRDIQNLPDDGHLYAAHVINDLWRAHRAATRSSSPTSASTRCGRRSTTTTSSRASLITSGGLGTMGFALPAAIGAKIARPDAEVWVVVGDGGFQMTMCELATHRAGEAQHQHRDHQQRLPRHGPAVAGVLLRTPLRRDAARRARTSSSSPRPTASRRRAVTDARGRRRRGATTARAHRGAPC